MKKDNKEHGRLDFGIRRSSGYGLVSSILLGCSFIAILAGVYISYTQGGASGLPAALFGLAGLVMSAVGVVFGFCGIRRRGYYHATDYLGLIGNGLLLAGMITLCYLAAG